MERIYSDDFNMVESNLNGFFVRISEINEMIKIGAIVINRERMKKYKFDSTVMYSNKNITNAGYNNNCDNCVCSSCKGNFCESVIGRCYNCYDCSGDDTGTEDDEQNNRWTDECEGYICNMES